ncbi:MAG: DUF1573 domain-containing protein [Ferruginibacter sp.]
MFKTFLFAVLPFMIVLTGCDVRRKDKQAVMPPQEIKNPTSVQLIDSTYDFGKIKEGEIVEYSYRFKNTGSNPLVVTNVAASCGCTVADKPEAPVKPGETGVIKVKFNSENRPGEAHKTVTVTSNAKPPFSELLLKGEVIGKQ